MARTSGGISAVTLFTEDLATTTRFYEEVFGLPLVFQDADSAAFRFEDTMLNLLSSRAATKLVAPAPVAPPEAGSRFQFSLDVDDVDATCAELELRGVRLLNGPMDRPWGVRTASFCDPAGHIWEIRT